MNTALENGVRGGTPVPLRLLRLAAHPTAVAAAFRQLVLHAPRRTVDSRRAVERLDAQFHFDAVCAVCAPYRTAFALEGARIGGKKLLWQLDPYASNRDYTAPGGFCPGGPAAGGGGRHLRHAPGHARLHRRPPEPLARQGAPAGVPGAAARPRNARPYRDAVCFLRQFVPHPAGAGFCAGTVLPPECPRPDPDHGGGRLAALCRQAGRAAAVLKDRFVRPGPLPPADAAALETGADILLSLGNAYDNQMPSKLFSYFGTGKPVLHLAVSETDPTLPYLARYPLGLVLQKKDGVTPEVLDRLSRWLAEVTGQRLPYEQVAALYPEFTPQQVARDFLAALS